MKKEKSHTCDQKIPKWEFVFVLENIAQQKQHTLYKPTCT